MEDREIYSDEELEEIKNIHSFKSLLDDVVANGGPVAVYLKSGDCFEGIVTIMGDALVVVSEDAGSLSVIKSSEVAAVKLVAPFACNFCGKEVGSPYGKFVAGYGIVCPDCFKTQAQQCKFHERLDIAFLWVDPMKGKSPDRVQKG
jgi:hypothetical protein